MLEHIESKCQIMVQGTSQICRPVIYRFMCWVDFGVRMDMA